MKKIMIFALAVCLIVSIAVIPVSSSGVYRVNIGQTLIINPGQP